MLGCAPGVAWWGGLAAAGAASVLGCGVATAQPDGDASTAITGASFQGLRFRQPAIAGPVVMSAGRAQIWKVGTTQRLLLHGDVRGDVKIELGGMKFNARRAAVWLEKLGGDGAGGGEAGGAGGEGDAYQIFVYLDDAATPAEAAGAIRVAAARLPVRGILIPTDGVRLKVDLPELKAPAIESEDGRFVEAGEERLAKVLRELAPAGGVSALPAEAVPGRLVSATSEGGAPGRAGASEPVARRESGGERGRPGTDDSLLPTETAREMRAQAREAGEIPEAAEPRRAIFSGDGVISLAPGNLKLVPSEDENVVLATDGVVLSYQDVATGRTLQMQAQRAVVFLKGGALSEFRAFSKADVNGIYLEGDVIASDGQYTLRGPRVYYDIQRDRAVVVDAVFWTYDERRRLPLYVRAKSIRQESADQFAANSVRMTNSAFADPEIAIGASSVTITRRRVAGGAEAEGEESSEPGAERTETQVDARNITLRVADVPIFYWPIYRGDPNQLPITDVRVENSSGSGAALKVRFNAYALLGLAPRSGLDADLQTDYYFDRGVGLGTRLGWQRASGRGSLFAYMVPNDRGTDVLKPGSKIERDNEFRGMIAAEHRYRFDANWSVALEATHLSDEAVIDTFFEDIAEQRRELTTRAYARRLEDNSALTIDAKGNLNDFVANEYLLQSRGYSVRKLPEVRYVRLTDDVLPEIKPGLVTYSSEYSVGILGLDFDEPLARQRGFNNNTLAQRAFGTDANGSIADRLRSSGLFEESITRLDTRHELSLQHRAGSINVQPFVIARVTAYDNDFAAYSPTEDDNTRTWAAAGVRLATSIERVDDTVDSRLLDLHRLRHIVEPSVTVFHAGTTVDRTDLPLYDDGVENLVEGTVARFGIAQTFQTQRGGPGRWHSVDVFKLNTDIVLSSGDTDSKSPIGRFFDYRPEYSNPGEYFVADAIWQLSDTFALTGSEVFDLDLNQQAATHGGFIVRHAANFQSYVDAHYINSQDQTIINFGSRYELSSRYQVSLGTTYDATRGGFQGVNFDIVRNMQNLSLGFGVGYNEITGETSFGFLIRPYGAQGEARVSGVGSRGGTSAFGG